MHTIETNTLKLPFLGSLENGEPFEYVLFSIDSKAAEIGILHWFLNRTQLHVGDSLNLHLPYHYNQILDTQCPITGKVMSAKHSEKDGGDIYQVSLTHGQYNGIEHSVKQLQKITSITELYIHLIKDSMILKAGIIVYFKHLVPFFSRIGNFSKEEYDNLKKYFLDDLENRILKNQSQLEELYKTAKEKIKKPEEIAIYTDLEALREVMESEISVSVFNIVFSEKKVPQLSDYINPQIGISMYIQAIKNLEKRLYSNFNHMVLIYLKSLA